MSSQNEEVDSCTLFVGEGDFSFSANYILESRRNKERVFASCLISGCLTERQQNNIRIIEENGGLVYTDVDATCLESHPGINKFCFSKIIFNFPHIPGKMNIRNNRQLVQQFLLSAGKVMEDTGAIYVTLCQGQGGTEIEKIKRKWSDTWQIVSLAASASLILFEVKCFDEKKFEAYRCTGFRGLQKPFNTTGALTHIFKRGRPVEVYGESIERNADIIDIYLQDCITLHKFIRKNSCQPSFKVISILNDFSTKLFHPYDQVTIDDLITCKKISSLSFDSDISEDIDYCKECLSNLFTIFLNKKTSGVFTFISCNLCCLKKVDLSEHPIHHIFSYISNDAESLLTNLPTLLRHLTEVYTFNRRKKMFVPEDESCFLNKNISTLINDNHESDTRKCSVKCVAHLYAKYSIHKGDEQFFYSDTEFFLLTDKIHNNTDMKDRDKAIKIGSILQYNKTEKFTCILLNLNTLACLKYHVMDHRVLFSDQSFYCSYEIFGFVEEVYRSISLYPPTYMHDTSFYIEKDFNENDFFMVVRNTVGPLIKSVTLIDSYFDKKLQKQSRCYQFIYQSCDMALTKEKANEIHTCIMRKVLQNSLNISLR